MNLKTVGVDGPIKNKLYPPAEWWESNGLPVPETEFKFHPDRKWRIDYYFPYLHIAIEIEGGVWKMGKDGQRGGRHNRSLGFLNDIKKYNAMAELGILLFCYPSINKIDCGQIRNAINLKRGIPY